MKKSTKIVAALGIAAGIGIAALPLGTFALDPTLESPQSTNVTVGLNIDSAVAISSDKTECINTMMPHAVDTCANAITFATNSSAGAVLAVKDADSNTSLVGPSGSDPIPANASAALGTAGWSISGGDLENPIAVTAANQTVKTLSAKGEATANMTYTYATATDQQAGQYRDVITYTVTAQ